MFLIAVGISANSIHWNGFIPMISLIWKWKWCLPFSFYCFLMLALWIAVILLFPPKEATLWCHSGGEQQSFPAHLLAQVKWTHFNVKRLGDAVWDVTTQREALHWCREIHADAFFIWNKRVWHCWNTFSIHQNSLYCWRTEVDPRPQISSFWWPQIHPCPEIPSHPQLPTRSAASVPTANTDRSALPLHSTVAAHAQRRAHASRPWTPICVNCCEILRITVYVIAILIKVG